MNYFMKKISMKNSLFLFSLHIQDDSEISIFIFTGGGTCEEEQIFFIHFFRVSRFQ